MCVRVCVYVHMQVCMWYTIIRASNACRTSVNSHPQMHSFQIFNAKFYYSIGIQLYLIRGMFHEEIAVRKCLCCTLLLLYTSLVIIVIKICELIT